MVRTINQFLLQELLLQRRMEFSVANLHMQNALERKFQDDGGTFSAPSGEENRTMQSIFCRNSSKS